MSNQSPRFLQKTVLDVQVKFSIDTMSSPIPLTMGSGINSLMEVDSASIIEYERTITGDVSAALLPVKVTGRLFLHPASPALGSITQVVDQYNLTGMITPGVITVSSVAGGWSYAFQDAVISKPFTGFSLAKVVEDYVFTFEAIPPAGASLSSIVNAAAGLVNLV